MGLFHQRVRTLFHVVLRMRYSIGVMKESEAPDLIQLAQKIEIEIGDESQ